MALNKLCCGTTKEKILDGNYWNNRYEENALGWDLGEISPPLKRYIDSLSDKSLRILIPGCGNTYEADYLLQQGFTNVTVIDIAPLLVEKLRRQFEGNASIHIILGDFFLHHGTYDLILEQTFFCALPPSMRTHYMANMHALLSPEGMVCGVLFNRMFDEGPPFGGSAEEYRLLFSGAFELLHLAPCTDSATPRAGSEVWIEFRKINNRSITRFWVNGAGDLGAFLNRIKDMPGIHSAVMNEPHTEVLIVSDRPLSVEQLRSIPPDETTMSLSLIGERS